MELVYNKELFNKVVNSHRDLWNAARDIRKFVILDSFFANQKDYVTMALRKYKSEKEYLNRVSKDLIRNILENNRLRPNTILTDIEGTQYRIVKIDVSYIIDIMDYNENDIDNMFEHHKPKIRVMALIGDFYTDICDKLPKLTVTEFNMKLGEKYNGI